MFQLSTNIEYMFKEAGESLEQRIAAAAQSGIQKVEMFTLENRDANSLKAALDDHGVQMWSLVNDPRTILANRSNHQEFLDNFRKSAEFAVAIGCPNVVCGSGTGLPFIPREPSLQAASEAIAAAAEIAAEFDLTILLEAVNARVDHPGVLFSCTEDSYSVAELVDSPRVKVLYDLYHSIAEGEDTSMVIPRVINRVGHVQIADFPGRGEPGAGAVNWEQQLDLLQRAGYSGVIGVECYPTKESTADAMQYIQSLCG